MQITAARPAPAVPSWPSPGWQTWTPTHDRHMARNPIDFMQAAPIAPNREAVAQADFAFGGNYMAHGSLDVFRGAELGSFASSKEAIAAAQALDGARGIVGVFKGAKGFDVRELLVSDANRRGFGDDIRDDPQAARPRPATLVPLRPVGDPNGSWGHGDYRSLSALRFIDQKLVAFVGEDHLIRR